jgi:hypothetical protein
MPERTIPPEVLDRLAQRHPAAMADLTEMVNHHRAQINECGTIAAAANLAAWMQEQGAGLAGAWAGLAITKLAEQHDQTAALEQLALYESAVTDLLAWGQKKYGQLMAPGEETELPELLGARVGQASGYRRAISRLCERLGLPGADWERLADQTVTATGPGDDRG